MPPRNPHHTSRRIFIAQGLGLTAAALAAPTQAMSTDEHSIAAPTGAGLTFRPDFEWGVATAAIQIEGAADEAGRGRSIWDTFCQQPGRIADRSTPAISCDHYHRFVDDIACMAELGVKHYRLSIAWPRVIPDGRGALNPHGLDFYSRLVDGLLAQGIQPHVTLYHWDLPQALQDRYGGWQGREVAEDFAAYATAVVSRLGDRVDRWMPLNEAATFACYNGYGIGHPAPHAPGLALASARDRAQVIHHALLAHGLACQAIRAASPQPCRIAIAENFKSCVPLIETAEHIAAARRAFADDYVNGAILVPMLEGKFDDAWAERHRERLPAVAAGDWAIIGQPIDEIGFNCYTGDYVRATASSDGYEIVPFSDGYPKGGAAWLNIVPEAAYWGIRFLSEKLGTRRLPIFLSENGIADGSDADSAGLVRDIDRIAYARAYLRQVQRALAEGYAVNGYYHWSLLDNFEWAFGYTKRFGLVHVDFASQRRTPKLAYHWYREVIRLGRPL